MPKWATRRPGQYIIYQKTCSSAQCRVRGKPSTMIPVDTSIRWVHNSVRSLQSSPKTTPTKEPEWYNSILQPTDRRDIELPATVESWCIYCREQTQLSRIHRLGGPLVFVAHYTSSHSQHACDVNVSVDRGQDLYLWTKGYLRLSIITSHPSTSPLGSSIAM